MSLLTPWALGLAALAAIPVALHLFRRDSRRRMAFPAIRYLRSASETSARAVKLRDRLLLFVRIGLVAVIAIAAAGPLVGRGGASDHVATDVVLLIDNSGSMSRLAGDASLLDRQRARAREILDVARSSDRFWVLPAIGSILASGVPATAAERSVERVQATDAAADLGARLEEAIRVLPAGPRPREIVILSDFQATALPDRPIDVPAGIRIVASWIRGSDVNAAVLALTVDAPRGGADGTVIASLAPPRPGSSVDTVEVRLAVDGETASISRAREGGEAVLRLPDPGIGEYAVSVEIPPSGLRSDDRRHFVLRTLEPPSVARYGPAESFVARALETLADAGRVVVRPTSESVAATVMEGVVPPGARASQGVRILIPPTDDELLARFNEGLDRLGVPWRLDIVDVPGRLTIAPAPEVPGLESIRIQGRHKLSRVAAGADSVLLRTADGSPWMVAGRAAGSGYLLIRTPLSPEHTDLPVSAAMVPFIEAGLFRWAGLGAELPTPTPAGFASLLPPDADSVAGPSGVGVRVDGGSPYTALRAGVYTVFRAGGATELLAVTVPVSESSLRSPPPGDLGDAIGSVGFVLARTDAQWRAAMYGSRRGTSLAPYLVAVAFLLVLAEAALATPRERASGSAPEESTAGSRP